MKYIWLFISFLFMALLGVETLNGASSLSDTKEEGIIMMEDDELLLANEAAGYIVSLASDRMAGDMLMADPLSLAGQLRAWGRTSRVVYPSFLFSKFVVWRAAKLRMENLSSSSSRFYSTLPCPCWQIASEHYIFGMRRILI